MTNYSYEEQKEIIQKCMDKNGQVNKALFDALNIDIKDRNWNKFITDNNIVIDITDIYSMTNRLKDRSCEIAAYLMANNGDIKIRNVIMQAYMPLAHKISSNMKNNILGNKTDSEIEDLEIEFSIMIADAISSGKFDVFRGTSLSTYFNNVISYNLYIKAEKNSAFPMSDWVAINMHRVKDWLDEGNTLNTEEDYRKCSEKTGLYVSSIKLFEKVLRSRSETLHFDNIDELEIIESYLLNDVDFSMDDRIAQKEDSSLLKKAFDTLTDIEKFIIEKKYGYNTESEEEMSLSDILPLVQEMFNENLKYGTLKNIHKNALAKLRDTLGDKVSLVFAA